MDEPSKPAAESVIEDQAENSVEASATEAEPPKEKLTPLQAIRQKQAALQQNRTGGGKGGKAKVAGQGGAAASRKPTTGRQSYGGNS